ncbi:hypothetical protein [Streptomyces sp. WZ-12]|nr:hypothetical protein [Streptomyces sp. WZ-12]
MDAVVGQGAAEQLPRSARSARAVLITGAGPPEEAGRRPGRRRVRAGGHG